MNSIWRDVRYGLRMLVKSPGFSAVAVLALALGIGGNTAIFSVVYATLLEPLHYQDPDRLVMVWSKPRPEFRNATSVGDFLDWREKSSVFEGLHAWTDRHVSVATSERPQSIEAGLVTPGWIVNHGLVIRLGRDFVKEEGTPGKDRVVVLSDSLWRGTYGADPGIVGKQVRIDGESHTVVGVLAYGPADRMERKLYLPLVFRPEQINHDLNWLTVMGRLKPGVTLQQANAQMAVISSQIAEAYPTERKGWSVSVEPLQNNFLDRDTIRGLWLLLAAVAFVLLIACANVANLQLARGAARQRELVVRAALGAGRRRLVRQLLTESVLLAVVGGALGVALALGLLDVIEATMPPYTLPSEADVRLSVPVLLFTIAATTLAGVLFGCAPAWQASRLNLAETLKEGGRSAASGRHRVRRALVMVEFGLALALLAGGGLAIHSLIKLTRVDLGFRTERLLVVNLPVPDTRLRDADAVRVFYRHLLERVEAVPGVTRATVSTGIPGWGTSFGGGFQVVGQPVPEGSEFRGAGYNMVSPAYYETFGIRMLSGRPLSAEDAERGAPVVVVNETFAKRYLDGLDPLAQRLSVQMPRIGLQAPGPAVAWQIVGVTRDVRNGGPRNEAFPQIDFPFWQSPWPAAQVSLRTAVAPASLVPSLAEIVQSLDPDLPLANPRTMDEIVRRALAADRFRALLFGGFAATALVLAALGIYGVMSFVVAQRRQELGLRLALGASRPRVLGMVLRDGMKTALGGTLLGCLGAYWVGRSMQGMFPGVPSLDLTTFAAVAVVLLAAAVLACLRPGAARRGRRPAGRAAGRVGRRLGRGEPRRVALAARRVERGDAHRPAERDRTARLGALQARHLAGAQARRLGAAHARHLGAAEARLAAVRRVAEREAWQLDAHEHDAALGLEAGCRDPVADSLPVEPRQLPLAEDVHEPGPGLAVARVRLRRVALGGPVRLGRPRPLGEAEELRHEVVVEPPVRSQRLRPQVALHPEDVRLAVVGEPLLADEDRRIERVSVAVEAHVAVVVEGNELERLAQVHVAAPVEAALVRVRVPGEVEVEVGHGAQHDLEAAVGEAVGEVLGAPARERCSRRRRASRARRMRDSG